VIPKPKRHGHPVIFRPKPKPVAQGKAPRDRSTYSAADLP
jgi:hypothetical protein